jgi:hypothetical protein
MFSNTGANLCTQVRVRGRVLVVRGRGFEPPVGSVLGWMNTGSLSSCGVFASDNSVLVYV